MPTRHNIADVPIEKLMENIGKQIRTNINSGSVISGNGIIEGKIKSVELSCFYVDGIVKRTGFGDITKTFWECSIRSWGWIEFLDEPVEEVSLAVTIRK